MDKLAKLRNLETDASAVYGNIQWNLGGVVGIAAIILNPSLLFISNIPSMISVSGLTLNGNQCLGTALAQQERRDRATELVNAAKRSLICEALELAADFLVRASRISSSGTDPYEDDDYFSSDIKELWNSKANRAGWLIEAADRDFFEMCAAPLRNCIRHNNGRLTPQKSIVYSGQPRGRSIKLSLQWRKDGENHIELTLSEAHDIFTAIRAIVDTGLQRAVAEVK